MIDMLLKNSSRGDLGVHEGRLGADVVGAIPHGHDSVMDPWYRLGSGDPLQAAFVLAHLGHMSGDAERRTLMDMITVAPAAALGVADDGLHLAGSADLVVFEARSEAEALRLQRPRHLVLRAGRVLAGTQPARSFVNWHGVSEEIDFRRADSSGCVARPARAVAPSNPRLARESSSGTAPLSPANHDSSQSGPVPVPVPWL